MDTMPCARCGREMRRDRFFLTCCLCRAGFNLMELARMTGCQAWRSCGRGKPGVWKHSEYDVGTPAELLT